MNIVAAEHGLDLGRNAPGYDRSPGLHMSTIYNSLYRALEPKRYGKEGDPLPMDKLEAGMIWEELLEAGFKQRPGLAFQAWRPGEFRTEEHGIAYSPDLIITNGDTRVGEIKLTWMSCKEAPVSLEQAIAAGRPDLANTRTEFGPRFSKWFTQIQVYAYHLELLDARLIVLFINGNYKPPSPVPLAWDLRFTPEELAEEWGMVLAHGKAEGLVP